MSDNDKLALACSRFWMDNPEARQCLEHTPQARPPRENDRQSTPHVCPSCSKVPATYYGKLVRQGEEVPQCPNHGGRTVDGKFVAAPSSPSLIPVETTASRGGRSAGRS